MRSERRLGAPAAAAAARRGKMARRFGRATSRCEEIQTHPRKMATSAVWLCLCLLFPSAEAGLYTASDQIVLLTQENVESVLINSTAAMVVEFYASWCGHCVAFSPTYKALARDIKGVYRAAATLKAFSHSDSRCVHFQLCTAGLVRCLKKKLLLNILRIKKIYNLVF